MQPEGKESPVQVTVIALDGAADRPIGAGVLVRDDVVLADETLSRHLYHRRALFPRKSDDLVVLFEDDGPDERDPGVPAYAVELVDGERRERFDVPRLYRSLGTPRPWVGFGLAGRSTLPISELPVEAREGLDEGPLERNSLLCALMHKCC